MGHFSVSCALSGLSIQHGPCYYVPLIPDEHNKGRIGGEHLICSNDGAKALFKPAFLPIKGEYDTYGRLENPEKNANTELIEKMLGVDIETFLDDPCKYTVQREEFVSSRDTEDGKCRWEMRDVQLAGCFIHEFAYKAAYEHVMSDESSFYKCFPVGDYLLKAMGLDEPTKDPKEQRYNLIYKVAGVDTHVIQSDGTFSHISKVLDNGYEEVKPAYRVDKLEKDWKEVTGHELKAPEYFKTTHIANKNFDLARDALRKEVEGQKEIDEIEKSIKESVKEKAKDLLEKIDVVAALCRLRRGGIDLFRWQECTERYGDLIREDNDDIRKLICELQSLDLFMFCNNKMYMPTLSGPQDGDSKSELALAKASAKYIEDKHGEYVKQMEEWGMEA
jgi:hypothetical protein